MSKAYALSAEETKNLNNWLITKRIELNNRTRRELSDVVNMAKLFKNVNAKLVNMTNYTSHGSLALKLINWEAFNLKVLLKTGLKLPRLALEKLAGGDINALRIVLCHLMRIERDGVALMSHRSASASESAKTQNQSQTADTPEGSHYEGQQLSSCNEEETKNYLDLIRINEKKETFISLLSQKIKYLESTILEKEERIKQLLDHLTALSTRVISVDSNLKNAELPPALTQK